MKTVGIVVLFALSGLSCDGPSDSPQEVSRVSTPTTTISVPQTAPQTPIRPDLGQSIPVPTTLPDTKCAEWYPLAMQVGWPEDLWPRLSQLAFRESRCDPSVTSRHEDAGLLQIHPDSWCRPNRYNDIGWLQAQGVIDKCSDLYDPETNLRAALHIYTYSLYQNGNGWHPWRT
jgi:hypothetical protein